MTEGCFVRRRLLKGIGAAAMIALAAGSLDVVAVQAQQVDLALQRLDSCVTTPARAPSSQQDIVNAMNPAITDPDKVAWCFFLYGNMGPAAAGQNVLFETWANDGQTFNASPQWPTAPQAKVFRPNILHQVQQAQRGAGLGRAARPFVVPPAGQLKAGDNVEETRRNKSAFDFIVSNNLYKVTGLQSAFAKFAGDRKPLAFPSDAIEVKANWFPVANPDDPTKSGIPGYTGSPNDAGRFYHVNTAGGKDYALVSMHIISKMVPNWTWATFEHQNNPGRCEFIGCRDTFGSVPAVIPPDTLVPDPNDPTYANTRNNPAPYAPCAKTPSLDALFGAAAIDPVFKNYCLKGSQVDFTDASGMAIRVGNSITEEGFDFQASCMSCHGRAAFDQRGFPTTLAGFDPVTGAPLGPVHGEWFWTTNIGGPWAPAAMPPVGIQTVPGAVEADFVWSIPFCAFNDTNGTVDFTNAKPQTSICAEK
jgi:hypothetical protein